jgi:hypothetical protein
MTVRLVQQSIDVPVIRPSAPVSAIAQLLATRESQIRRMVARGDLQAHIVGKRGIRVFLDSVEALQRDQLVKAKKPDLAGQAPPPKPMSGATRAAHRQSVGYLQGLGLVPASRR